jgi:hypothetical protein
MRTVGDNGRVPPVRKTDGTRALPRDQMFQTWRVEICPAGQLVLAEMLSRT